LNSKYDLDLGYIDGILLSDTPSNDGEQMCQMILNSHQEPQRYGPDKLVPSARQPAFANLITRFFLWKTLLKRPGKIHTKHTCPACQ